MSGGTPYEYFFINELSGGINLFDSPLTMKDNEMQEARNCFINNNGAITKRHGYDHVSSHTIANANGLWEIYRYYNVTTVETMVSAQTYPYTKVYTYDPTSGYTEVTGGSDLVSQKVRFKTYKNICFIWDEGGNWQYHEAGTGVKADVIFDSSDPTYLATKKNIRTMEICDDRIFVVFDDLPNSVFYSDYGGWNTSPGTDMLFKMSNYFNIGEQGTDAIGITALKSYSNNGELLVFRQNDTWVLLGVGNTDYQLRKFRGEAGAASQDGVTETENGQVMVMGNQKVYWIEGDNMISVDYNILPKIQNYNMNESIAEYDQKNNCVWFTFPEGILVWNMSRRLNEPTAVGWTWFDIQPNVIARFKSAADNNEMYLAFQGDTKMYQYGNSNSDHGSNIYFVIQTKLYDLDQFAEKKMIRGFKALMDARTTTPFTVKIFLNDGETIFTKPMVINVWGDTWGSGVWGTFIWSSANRINGSIDVGGDINCFEFSIRIESNDTNTLVLYRLAVEMMQRNRERNMTKTW